MKTSIHFTPLILCLFCLTPDLPARTLESAGDNTLLSEASHTLTTTVSCAVPTGLYTSNVTESSATLNWSSVSNAQNYSVQIREPYGNWSYIAGSPFMNTYATVYGLSPNTTYEWRVRANCVYGEYSDWSYPESFTTEGSSSCEAPYWLETFNITETTATLDWESVSGANSYTIQWRYPGGAWHTLVKSWPYSSVNIGGLEPATTYEWRVRSNCSYGNHSDWSYPDSFTTLGNTCHAPTNLYTTYITESSATLSWSPVSGAESYSVQIRNPYGTWTTIPGSPFYGTSATVDNLSPGTTYEWRVRANCGYGYKSYWSYPETFTTLGSFDCHPPVYLNTLNITSTTATWDWEPVAGAVSYSVQWRYPGGNWNTLYGGPWTSTHLNVWGLQPGTTYEWRVRSNCSYGNHSDWSYPEVFTTLGASCHKPQDLTTTNITDVSATLSWSPVSGAQDYSVQIRLPNGLWQYVPGSPFTQTSVTVNNLSPGTTYSWRVRANCGYGQHSYWSVVMTFTTTGSTPCGTPDTAYTSGVTDTEATLNWSAVSGALSYTIQWRNPGGPWFTLPTGPWLNHSLHVSGLDPNTVYEWRVRANCPNGLVSDWTPVVGFITLGGSVVGNDFCSQAIVLTVGDTCANTTATNVDATPSTPAPQGNCPTTEYRDVWFKFTMPNVSYPSVTIRTTALTLGDAVMEVYIGNTCSNLAYLICENDNANGNGSTMPVIHLVGGAGITVWVRVWGINGNTGTFNICVLNHESDNLAENVTRIAIPDDGEVPNQFVEESGIDISEIGDQNNDDPQTMYVTPNPASDVLNISYLQAENMITGLVLVDMSGQVVMKRDYQGPGAEEFQEQLNISDVLPGTYLLQAITTTGILTEKVMVVR